MAKKNNGREPDYVRYEMLKRKIQAEAVDHRQYQEMIAEAARECGI